MDSTDPEINKLLMLTEQFQRICASHGCDGNENISVPDGSRPPEHLNSLFHQLFEKVYDIIRQLKGIAEEERISVTSAENRRVHPVPERPLERIDNGAVNDCLEVRARIFTCVEAERKRAEDIINYLATKPPEDSCHEFLEKLKNLEEKCSWLKGQATSLKCELQVKNDQLVDTENDIGELSQKLLACYTSYESTKTDLLNCEKNMKWLAAEATEAKTRCNEFKKCAELAVEQTAVMTHERDQALKLVDHLQTKAHSLEQENTTIAVRLKEIEKAYSDISVELDVACGELGRVAEKERQMEENVSKIMHECRERVQAETERVKSDMQVDIDALRSENDRLNLEIIEWKLKYEQCQRDCRNIAAMYEQLHSSVVSSTQTEAAEKTEAIRRAAAAECARDEALFSKQQLMLKIEKLEIALSKTTERFNGDLHTKHSRIDDLQRQVTILTEENAKCCSEKVEMERELSDTRERCIGIEMQYRYKVKAAEDDAKTTMLACDAKISAIEESYKKTLNDMARELCTRQSIINRMMEDNKRRCGDVEEKLEEAKHELQEEQSNSRELARVKADQARRIASLEDELARSRRLVVNFK